MFSFLPLINNSGTIGLRFILLSISAIISSNAINILHSLFGLYSSTFYKDHPYHLSIQQKNYNPLNALRVHSLICQLTIDTLLHLDLQYINKFCQIRLDLFQNIQNVCVGNQEIAANLNCVFFLWFFVTSLKLILFYIVLLCQIQFLLFNILHPCLFHMPTFLLNLLIIFFYHRQH